MVSSGTVRCGSLLLVGSLLGLGLGCLRLSPYACRTDSDCDRTGMQGRCLEDGACAYPDVDDRCEGDWVRSPNAAVEPGGCVSPGSTGPLTEGLGTISASGLGPTGDPPSCGTMAPLEINTAFLSTSEVLEGYPLLLSVESAAIADGIAASGGDPVVVGPDGELLASELEGLDPITDTLTMWVRLPSYPLGEPLPLELRWGTSATPGASAEVWADHYVGVWHLGDALSGVDGDEMRNSANVTEPGRTSGQMQPEQSVPGVVGRGLQFDGDDDIVTIDAEFVGQLDSYSISFWVRYDGPADGPGDYFQRLNGDYFYPRCWRLAETVVFCQYTVDEMVTGIGNGFPQEVGQLLHLALVRDAEAATHRFYIDGEQIAQNDDPPGATLPDDGYAFELGHGELGTLPGMLDEVRVADQPLPASWVRADARTQLQPAAVLAGVGAPAPIPCSG